MCPITSHSTDKATSLLDVKCNPVAREQVQGISGTSNTLAYSVAKDGVLLREQ
jgi:hypothetical protein